MSVEIERAIFNGQTEDQRRKRKDDIFKGSDPFENSIEFRSMCHLISSAEQRTQFAKAKRKGSCQRLQKNIHAESK